MRRAGFVVLAALLGLALADCSTKQDDTVTVSQPTPPHGHAYFDLKFRPAETARVDAPDAIWNADTLDTCYSNGICAVQGTANAPSWGWTLRCNGDPSCDQATYRIVPVNLRSGVRIAFDPQTVSDGQTTWSTITIDRTVPPGILTIKYETQLAAGRGTGWTIGRVNTQVLCGVALHTCPGLDVRDTNFSGAPVVSGNPPPIRNSVIGREANFILRARGPGSYRIANVSWDPSGWIYKPHRAFDGTLPSSLGYGELHNQPLTVYWASSGEQHVGVNAVLVRSDNQEITHASANVAYNVTLPVADAALLVHPERISVGPRSDAPGQWLRWGDAARNREAIGIRYRVTDAHGFPGTITITQLISGSISYTPNIGPGYGQGMTAALDGGPFWRRPVSTRSAFGPAPFDAPAVGLKSTDLSVTVNETFTTFFLYKPNLHGDWVTLRKGTWNWNAAATLVSADGNRWCLNGSSNCPAQAPGAIGAVGALQGSMDPPSWSTAFDDGLSVLRPGRPYTSIFPHP
jgi:hypothetical protein